MEDNVLLYLLQIVGGVGVPVFIIPIFLVIFIAEYQPVKNAFRSILQLNRQNVVPFQVLIEPDGISHRRNSYHSILLKIHDISPNLSPYLVPLIEPYGIYKMFQCSMIA